MNPPHLRSSDDDTLGEHTPSLELKTSADGSFSAYNAVFDECYHSLKDGALQESLYKHIIPAFSACENLENMRILDICFGLGYNTLASLYYRQIHTLPVNLHIYSPELDGSLLTNLIDFPYPEEFSHLPLREIVCALRDRGIYEDAHTHIEVRLIDAREYVQQLPTESIDVVYQDAFSPKKNPELWSEEYFAQLYRILAPNGILTTYSQSTAIRKNALACGFVVYDCVHNEGLVRGGSVMSKHELALPHYRLKRYGTP